MKHKLTDLLESVNSNLIDAQARFLEAQRTYQELFDRQRNLMIEIDKELLKIEADKS